MKKFIRCALLLASLGLQNCTHSLHDVYMSSFEPYHDLKAAKMVEARSEQFVIMGFVGNTNYVDEAYKHLLDKCPHGELTGVSTQFSTSHGFFSWTNKILIKAFCFDSTPTTAS